MTITIREANDDAVFCFVDDKYTLRELLNEDTKQLFITAVNTYLSYPFYVHFETYEDTQEDVLNFKNIEWLGDVRTILTMFNGSTYHAPVPCFRAEIPDEETLIELVEAYFFLAESNMFFIATQKKHLPYRQVQQNGKEQSFASLNALVHKYFITFSHDAQSVVLGMPSNAESEPEAILAQLTRTMAR